MVSTKDLKAAQALAPWLLLIFLAIPVLVGLAGVLLPSIGYSSAADQQALSLQAWQSLFSTPGLFHSVLLSVIPGLLSALIAFIIVFSFLATTSGGRTLNWIRRMTAPLLAFPHVAAAFGIAFLLTPSGFLFRLVSPLVSGWERPPDLLIINDPWALTMTLALIMKEVPFLLLMALAALPAIQADQRLAVARSLGYQRSTAWLWTVAPALYPALRLPIFAVIAYASTSVEVALILGPSLPAPLSVRTLSWFNDPDLSLRNLASAGALLQVAITAATIGLWILGERMISRVLAYYQQSGQRDFGARPLALLGRTGFIVTFSMLTLALVILIIQAFAGRWRFPDSFPDSLTLGHWRAQLPLLWDSLATTVTIAVTTVLIAFVLIVLTLEQQVSSARVHIGSGTHGNALIRVNHHHIISRLLYLPLLTPQIAFLFGYTVWLEKMQIPPGLLTVVLAHLVFVIPYMYLSLADAYRGLDKRWPMLAASLRITPTRFFLRIKLPMLIAALLSSLAIGFAVSNGLYLPTLLAGGGRVSTITTEALTMAAGGSRSTIAVWALIQAALPVLGFATALLLPRLIWKNRRGMKGFMQ
ncbi:MAG: ABC transporter permease [Pseudohongiella nitratireducens]|nr:ABC transporter permease [Pseudohongiella nitratireducens]MDF1622383.1 ABC transporter permease [Pseudohongiella nitratireducens]